MAQITLAGSDISCFKIIHCSCDAGVFACEELKSYIQKMTGSVLEDGTEQGTSDCVILFSVDDSLSKEDYRITLVEKKLTIAGGSPRGLIYGVYGFLELLGVRFIMPGVEKLGEGCSLDCGEWGHSQIFEYRQSDWPSGNDLAWSTKNRINSRAIPNKMGGHVKWRGFVHTMQAITGVPQNAQPCLSDPEVLEKAKKYVRHILEEDPTVDIISVSQNDNFNYCKCEKCAAVDEEEGSHMGTLIRFVNAVADDIKDDYPNVAIDTLAYQYTRKAPKITRPRPNVIIRLCSIECCFSHPLDDGSCEVNLAFCHDIEDWNKICNRLYIWDYVTDFSYYIPTFPNFGVLRENMRFFAEHGVKGMYPEGNYNSESGEFGELRCYLLAKLMDNPMMSEIEYNSHMDDFLSVYYGEGWRYIRAYIDFMVSEGKRHHVSIWTPAFGIYDKDTLAAIAPSIEQWWDNAEAAAGDRIEAVKRSRLQWTYISLMLKPDAKLGEKFFDDANSYSVRFNEWRNFAKRPDFSLPPNEWSFE